LSAGAVVVGVTTDHEGVVYDLDGTLVRLAVDWEAAARDATATFEAAGVSVSDPDLWSLLEAAPRHGLEADLEAVLSRHERRGARTSTRLPTADGLAAHENPVGVCSLNAESACRLALERHGLLDHVDAVVGRDSVGSHKPDPEPLLTTCRLLGVDPGATLFVGDSERDAVTAERAGVQFRYVEGTAPED
jgi:phosphoglycolate phosphatase